jgi:hypothetical protein
VTASALLQSLTGYGFLFSTERDLNKAHELRGGQTTAQLTLRVDGDGAMQLAAQRLALNLHEAGLNVQVAGGNAQHADLVLRKLTLEGGEPGAVLESVTRGVGATAAEPEQTPAALFKAERDFLDQHTLIPLLDLPRAYAVGGRVRDLKLRADGTPDLAGASLEDAQ